MDANTHFDGLLAVTADLIDLLTRENAALKEHRAETVNSLIGEKNALSRSYLSHVRELSEQPDLVADVDAGLKERLKGASERIRELMDDNVRMLQVAIETSRRVVDVIAEAAKDARPGPGVYSASGAVDAQGGGMQPRSFAVSVDQSL